MNWRKGYYLLALAALLFGLVPAVAGAQPDWSKVDPALRERLAREGTAEFHVVMAVQADVSGAAALKTKVEKTTYVYNLLRRTAEATQRPILDELAARGVPARSFYIYNAIAVTGGLDTVAWLASRPEVARIVSPPDPRPDPVYKNMTSEERIATVEWNIARIHAPEVWALGYRGDGLVVAGNDTGVDYTHPALVRQYRGCLNPPSCSSFNHNYNWWGGPGSPFPTDSDGHGTHTMGTMVGEDASQTNQIGVAPGARWIACAGLGGSDTVECFQFFLAPWDLNQQNPDPNKAPDAINNSWYDPTGYDYRPIIQNLNAAGIAVIKSAGNQGPGCSTITNPGYVPEIIATAAFAQGDIIASFSSRGPSDYYSPGNPYLKPEVAAPGVNIRSSVPGGGYQGGWQGTSMAAPHSTALVALIWNAAPCLWGDVPTTKQIMMQTAEPKIDSQCPPFVNHPNDVWGWGILDALNAVQTAILYCGGTGTLEGTVTDAATSNPIVGARVTAQREGGGQWSRLTGATGYYSMTLLNGIYTVTASAFGYIPAQATGVVVVTDTVTTQDFALQPSPTYVVSGTVTEAGSGSPLLATVEVLDTPIPPVQTDPATGYYSITVPEGTYTFRASAPLHQPVERQVVVDRNQTQNFSLPTLPCILLVDDDQNGPDVRSFYTTALDNLGHTYNVWDTSSQGDPAAADLSGYRIVVWFTGYPWGSTFTSANEAAVAAYLDAGGNFFLSSEDYLYDMGLTPFGQNYLGISSYTDDVREIDVIGNAGNPIGQDLGPYYLTNPPGWTGSLWTDYVSGPQTPFRYQASGRNNSTNRDGGVYKTVFFGWPFEGISALADRSTVLGRIVDYFGGCAVQPGILTGQVTHDYYGTPIAEATVTATPAAEGAAIQATTDPNGYYTITLDAGTYNVTASKDGYTTETIPGVVVVGGGVTVLDIALSSPVIVVSPESLHAHILPSGTVTLTLNVANPGDMDLTFEIAETTETLRLAGRRPAEPPVAYVPEAVAEQVGAAPEAPAGGKAGTLWARPEAVLWDNGPLVTHQDACAGGTQDASRLQTSLGMTTLGFGHQFANGYRMSDDFTVADPGGWNIDTITFFAYQTGAPINPSPITGVYLQIWNGPPWVVGSSVIWGDLSTNRLLSSTFTSIQRDSETSPCPNNRYIFANVAQVGIWLPPGQYWLDWTTNGNPSYTGPWAPPITILGQRTTGDAYQYTGAWAPALDGGTSTQQGMPFVIEGSIVAPIDVPWVSEEPVSGTVPAGGSLDVDVVFTALPPYNVVGESYTATLVFSHNDPERGEVRVPVTMTVVDCWPPVQDPDFDWTPAAPYVGEEVTFSGWVGAGSEPISYTWELGDGEFAIGQTVTHTYAVAGTYVVTLTVSNCGGQYQAQVSHPVEVRCAPVVEADFTWTPPTPTVGQETLFTATVNPPTATTPLTYNWDWGDGHTEVLTEPTALHTYTSAGTYTVLLTVTNDCSLVTATHEVVVVPPCQEPAGADFSWTPAEPVVGEPVTFTGTVVSGTEPLTYEWAFGDGEAGSGAVVTHTYSAAGIYTVLLTVTNDCGLVTATHEVVVVPPCEEPAGADFSWTPITPTVGQAVTFTGTVVSGTEPLTYEWAFGDGEAGSGQVVQHTYAATGTYDVLLTVTNACGTATATHTLAVIPAPPVRHYIYLPLVFKGYSP